MRKALLIAILSSLPFAANAQKSVSLEEALEGEIMHALPNGEVATLHYKDGKSLPESTDRASFIKARPNFKVFSDASLYQWEITMRFTGQQVPVSVKVDNVGEPQIERVMDESLGILNTPKADENWVVETPGVCMVTRKEACGAWLFESQPHIFILKATILYADGQTETLYQSWPIDPARILPELVIGPGE